MTTEPGTPLPWAIDPHSDETIALHAPKGNQHVCTLEYRGEIISPCPKEQRLTRLSESRRETDAEYIVTAANYFPRLLKACKAMSEVASIADPMDCFGWKPTVKALNDLLAEVNAS